MLILISSLRRKKNGKWNRVNFLGGRGDALVPPSFGNGKQANVLTTPPYFKAKAGPIK